MEQAHGEAFAQLTPAQRQMLLTELAAVVPPSEQPVSDDPRHLARLATRAEIRNPGTLERVLGRAGSPSGMEAWASPAD